MFWRFGFDDEQAPGRRDQLVERGVDAARPRVDERGQRVGVGALELRELPVLEDLPGEGVAEGQLLQHVHIGGVAGLGALDRRELQLLEEHDGELLRRVRVDRLAGELVDLPEERVELGVELLGELSEPLRVGPDPDLLQVGQDGNQRHLEGLVEAREVVLLEERRPGLPPAARRLRPGRPSTPPAAPGPRRPPELPARSVSSALGHGRAAGFRHQLVERVPAPARVQEIRRDGRVVDAARGRVTPAPRAQPTSAFVSCPARVTPAGRSGQPA